MRLFTGLSIPSEITGALGTVIEELRPTARARWSPLENLHITCKFIGAWPEDRLAQLETALASVEAPDPISITVAGFGFLPNPHRPKILFAGVRGDAGLARLAERIDLALVPLGVKREERAYTPHLTLARIGSENGSENMGALRERMLAASEAAEFGAFTAREFHIYLSEARGNGSAYSIIGSYPLEKAASS
jgi:2'-5' RNA ligase